MLKQKLMETNKLKILNEKRKAQNNNNNNNDKISLTAIIKNQAEVGSF